MHNPIEDIARALYSAIENESYLPNIEYEVRGEKRTRRPSSQEIAVYNFPQMWSSTSLGFGGIGGQAFTKAYTTILVCGQTAAVFFGGRHAYTLTITPALEADMRLFKMEAVARKGKYII